MQAGNIILNEFKSLGANELHPRLMGELADELAKFQRNIIFKKS